MPDLLLVRARWIVTGAGDSDAVLTDGAVLVEGDTIAAVGDWSTLRAGYTQARVLGSERMALLPGLVNAHHHSAGATWLQHGVGDDLLELWLLDLGRARAMDVHLGTLLSAARLLRSGVTAVVDVHSGGGSAEHYAARMGDALRAYEAAGLRVAFAAGISDQSHLVAGDGKGEDERFLASLPPAAQAAARRELPGPDDVDEADYFGIMERYRQHYAGHPTVEIWFAPPGPQWVSDGFMQRIAERAAQWDTGVQTHVAESIYEKLHGPRFHAKPIALHLRDLGVLSPRFSIAHGVWLNEEEVAALAETGAAVSHNPGSNLRLRAGIAPLNAMRAAGVTLALGMDGTTLDDDEDMFSEMRLAMRLHRTPLLRSPAPPPREVFAMATTGGAKLLRKEGRLGRLAPGHAADLVMIDLERLCWPWVAPEADPRDLVLMRAKAGDVRMVMVGGRIVLEDGKPTGFDLEAAGREFRAQLAALPASDEAARAIAQLRPHVEAHYARWEMPEPVPYTRYNSRR
jgi:cytosine/adenosine deaminase-related metal-dependent hydrolase